MTLNPAVFECFILMLERQKSYLASLSFLEQFLGTFSISNSFLKSDTPLLCSAKVVYVSVNYCVVVPLEVLAVALPMLLSLAL